MTPTPQLIDLDKINRRSSALRFRSGGTDQGHKADLVLALQRGGQPFDPVILWRDPEGQPSERLLIVDGVHRVAAYHAAKWSKPIPAVILSGDWRGALAAALGGNTRHVLPLPQIDRINAAWRLVREPVEPRFKVREIAILAAVSPRVVDKMRARWREMQGAGAVPTGDWSRDQHAKEMTQDDDWQPLTESARKAAIATLVGEIRDLLDRRKRGDMPILCDSEAVNIAILTALGDPRIKDLVDYYYGDEADEWADHARNHSDLLPELWADEADPEPAF